MPPAACKRGRVRIRHTCRIRGRAAPVAGQGDSVARPVRRRARVSRQLAKARKLQGQNPGACEGSSRPTTPA